MQPARRAFLFGRQRPRTTWEAFIHGLERKVEGRVRHHAKRPGAATLVPAHRDDARLARALCVEFGVRMSLAGADTNPQEETVGGAVTGPVLEIDPRRLNGLSTDPGGGILAEPGCRLADLAAAGLPQFRDAEPDCTLAAWLAVATGWRPGCTSDSGVAAVDVLLSDGTTESLGPFGASDSRPLRSATIQRLIPFLFQLADSADARACRRAEVWPCRYRLDALRPAAHAEVNLAHLLLGHHGELAWIESVLLAPLEDFASDSGQRAPCEAARAWPPGEEADTRAMAQRLERQIKRVFDPLDLYRRKNCDV